MASGFGESTCREPPAVLDLILTMVMTMMLTNLDAVLSLI